MMTSLWENGAPVNVWATDDNEPRRFVWRETVYPIKTIVKRWRVDRGWWRIRVQRDYFQLETANGYLVDVYHDLSTGKWYLQRWYD